MKKNRATDGWMQLHWKQLVVHGLILILFLLFMVFVVVPVFDIFESTEGESNLQNISVPSQTGKIRYNFDRFDIHTDALELSGWAFIEGQSFEGSQIYLVLKSQSDTYVFDTVSQKRTDVTAAFIKSGLNLNEAGFWAIIPLRNTKNGVYNVGIYIKKGDIEALQYTGKSVTR